MTERDYEREIEDRANARWGDPLDNLRDRGDVERIHDQQQADYDWRAQVGVGHGEDRERRDDG